MTTPPENNAVTAVIADWQEKKSAHDRLNAELLLRNKAALFDALIAASITAIVVSFDGYGDEGQLTGLEVKAGDQTAALPETQIEIACAVWDKAAPDCATVSITDAIEHLVYLLLEKAYGGWQDGDGAYGDFTFDVAARTITLDYNERFTSSEYFQDVF